MKIRKSSAFCLIGMAFLLAGCQSSADSPSGKRIMRVGYFPNITHSQALIGMARGDFQAALGTEVEIQATQFNAGPSAIEAIFAGQIDLTYIGPNPAINGFIKSGGKALRIVCGATSGGAALIVRPAAMIRSAADLAGRKIASPQLGNTQDVALRRYILDNGLKTLEQGGTVEVVPTDNPLILDMFRLGTIDGAWVPEPWASRLVVEGGGEVFLDERDLWTDTNGEFVTAHIIVSAKFLAQHPDLVKAWIRAHVEVTQWELDNPVEARALLNLEIEKLTGKKLAAEVLSMAWGRMTVSWDPISASLFTSAQSAFEAGFLKEEPVLDGIYDLTLLNEVLQEKSLPAVE
ncbi:MAG: ABC transporter substrate-binding protein [Anaerolineales bacterium]|nr:ABC transporter substrate-binding protein [Anaerolineales bacterium]